MLFNQINTRADISSSRELERLIGSGSANNSGEAVNTKNAMRVTAVYSCVMVVAESLAQLPFLLYEKDGDRKNRAVNESLYDLLHDAPNEFQTSFDWRLTKTAHALTHGAGYSFINRSINGQILEFLPIHPDNMEVVLHKNFKIDYIFTDSDGVKITLRPDQVFRVTGFSLDGVHGISPIEYHRQTIGTALAADKHTALTFKNGAKMSGILQNTGHFSSDEVARRVKESWDEANSGTNSHKTALLEDGLEWKQVSMSHRDAQYIESRKFQLEEIARIYRVPLHKIGHLDRATNNNIEHQGLEFVTDTLMPWNCRWEQSVTRDLIPKKDRKRLYAELLVDGLLRGDSKARSEFYGKAVGRPWMTVNEARRAENRNPIDGGDELAKPLNIGTGEQDAV